MAILLGLRHFCIFRKNTNFVQNHRNRVRIVYEKEANSYELAPFSLPLGLSVKDYTYIIDLVRTSDGEGTTVNNLLLLVH